MQKEGEASVIVVDGKKAVLPAGDAPKKLFRDESGKRFAYDRPDGFRLVYVVGDGAFVGPTMSGSAVEFDKAPPVEKALGEMFEHAGSHRPSLVTEVKKTLGEAGTATMLAESAHVDDKIWDETFATLGASEQDTVKKSLETYLEVGKPTSGLRRAVAWVPLKKEEKKAVYVARAKELTKPLEEPRAVAVLVRAVAALDKKQGADLGCEVLQVKPAESDDADARDVLNEAAALAIAHGEGTCKELEAILLNDACRPWVRCGPNGPNDGRETSTQLEPLCTRAEVEKTIAAELERTPSDVMGGSRGTRTALFAFAALVAKDALPLAFKEAHERRRFSIVQPKEPECDASEIGKPCHCDEGLIRDQACRHADPRVKAGICQFDVDAKEKKISGVVASMGH